MTEQSSVAEGLEHTENQDEIDEEELKRRDEERQHAVKLSEELREKATSKMEFKMRNMHTVDSRPSSAYLRRLDGSIKKNSAFVKKLSKITEQQRASLTSDLQGLNLSKYIQEAAINIAEAKLKGGDVGCTVHLCSLLHLRYGEFSSMLLEQLQKIYSTGIKKDDDKSSVTVKYRLGLRLTGELILGGIIDEDISTSLLADMLTAITHADEQEHPYLTVVLNFVRHCAEDIAGIFPRKQRLLLDKYGIQPQKSKLLPKAKQEQFHNILRKYFASVKRHMVMEHKAMHKRERHNHHLLVTKGELSEERNMENETAQKAYDKLLTNTSTLAELLDEDMPDLPEYQAPQEESDISIELQIPTGIADAAEADPNSLWEDEDTRSFYEGITDIRPFVPAILYEGRKRSTSESSDSATTANEGETPGNDEQETVEEEMDEEKVLEQVIQDTEQISIEEEVGMAPVDEDDEESTSTQGVESGSVPSLLDEYTQRLPTLMNRKFVNEFAVEFCMSLNTKANRKKLARSLFNVDRNRMDLVPFYARLVATLHQCLDDIAPFLVDLLVRDFRYQVYKKDQVHIHTKLKNVRFIAEMTKFGLCRKAETMKCITLLLHDFKHHNLEMACLFMEHCGRFLLRSPDSHLRAKALLEIMVRKKRVQHLDGRQKSLVENALYYANPPEQPQIVHQSRPPLVEYVMKLLYKDLSKHTTEKVLRQMRKLAWTEPEVFQLGVTSLTQIWHVKFNNVHCMANLLAGLKSYQEEVVIQVVDGVLEDIRLGLEVNVAKMNQRRVSAIKFLGELYNYQLLESNVIFKTLYMLLSFGATPDGTPSPLDPFDNYFRVRLICILLDTCGQYFDRGSSKKKLDAFLVFFQCYLFGKRQPLPLEVEHLVMDTIEDLRPDMEMIATQQEAYEAALELERKFRDKIGHSADQEIEDEEGGEESDDEEERHGPEDQEDEEEQEGDIMEDDMLEEGLIQTEDTFEEEPVLKVAPGCLPSKEDDDFIAALDKLMNEELQSRRSDSAKVPVIDTAVPMHLKGPGVKKPTVHDEGELKMKFVLMTKQGRKQQLKELNIPVDHMLTSNVREAREALKHEQRAMKKLVLNYERKQEEEEYEAMVAKEKEQIRKMRKEPPRPAQQQPVIQPHFYQKRRPPAGGGTRGRGEASRGRRQNQRSFQRTPDGNSYN